MVYLLKIVFSHGYVSLPEGKLAKYLLYVHLHLACAMAEWTTHHSWVRTSSCTPSPCFFSKVGTWVPHCKKKHQLFKLLNHKSKERSLVTTDHSAVYTYDTYDILTIVHPHHSHSPLLWSISTFPQEERLVLDWASRPFRKVVLDPRISAGPDGPPQAGDMGSDSGT
jgi:hypothetical protein